MIWTITKADNKKQDFLWMDKFQRRGLGIKWTMVILMLVIMAILLAFLKYRKISHSQEDHPYTEFKEKLKEVCASPKLPMPEYKGVNSFFQFVTHPDTKHCYSWLEFGGEKIPIPTQDDMHCMDEIRKTKMICFNEEYEMTKDPCLVYSFTKDGDQQFERDMHMFSCDVHVFDGTQITGAEHVRRTEFWLEHAWDISEFPYDKPIEKDDDVTREDGVIRRRSLDFIAHALNHEGKKINFIKSDHVGREWLLLKQVVTHHDLLDIQQLGVRIHIPSFVNTMSGTARHEYFRELFEVFQGLSCMGYKYVLGRPAKYYKGSINVPEISKKYYVAYEMNFAKVIKKDE